MSASNSIHELVFPLNSVKCEPKDRRPSHCIRLTKKWLRQEEIDRAKLEGQTLILFHGWYGYNIQASPLTIL